MHGGGPYRMHHKFSFGMSPPLSCKTFEVYQMAVMERLDMLLSVDNFHSHFSECIN